MSSNEVFIVHHVGELIDRNIPENESQGHSITLGLYLEENFPLELFRRGEIAFILPILPWLSLNVYLLPKYGFHVVSHGLLLLDAAVVLYR